MQIQGEEKRLKGHHNARCYHWILIRVPRGTDDARKEKQNSNLSSHSHTPGNNYETQDLRSAWSLIDSPQQ